MRGLYSVAELMNAGKALVRAIGQIGTEFGTDHDLTLHAAARLLFGGQVAASHLYDALEPRTADATGRDAFSSLYGLVTEKPAVPARGLIALLTTLDAPYKIAAGTLITFPAEAFVDGVERSFTTLEDVDCPGRFLSGTPSLSAGSGVHKLRPKSDVGVAAYRARDLAQVKADGGASTWLVVVRSANPDDQSLDLLTPLPGALRDVPSETVEHYTTGVVVSAECTVAGVIGNVSQARVEVEVDGISPSPFAVLIEMGGGADEIGAVHPDTERTVALLEDTQACPPGFGNAQHFRELALSCPDVALDDVIVYRHVRGPGTIDLVCIGPSGGLRAPSYPDTNLGYVPWGNNTRYIGEVQAARIAAWLKTRTSYFDDVRVRSVEWDYRGAALAESGDARFLQAVCRVDMNVTPAVGYGPDCGSVIEVTPHTRDAAKLYPSTITSGIPLALKPGHRVWAAVGPATTNGRHPFATVVTEVLSVAHDRSYATIQPVTDLLPDNYALAVPGTSAFDLRIMRWGSAGPVTQPVLDATYAYFDRLGPGSYPIAPKGPGYVQRFWGPTLARPMPGLELDRWPPEGRRRSSGLRASELRAELLAVTGVERVGLGRLADDLLDYDPAPLMTLACVGVLPRYA
jgi:hypothetical protein